jgi:ferredoxin, 2Fe-2S
LVVADAVVRYVVAMSAFKVTFLPQGKTVEAKAGHTVLDTALLHGIDLDHACGGVCGCSTCHVIVKQGFSSLPPASDREEDMLDNAPFLQGTSRLACQIEVTSDLVVEIPPMNRNLVSEGQH